VAKNVRFVRTTKEKWLTRDTYDPLALYFCEDTQEMCKGDKVLTDGVRIVPTKADLPSCPCAADGVVYYVTETRNGYVMAPDRSGWLQTIYAPATDAYTVPESEIYNTVTTVGAVRDIENAIYEYVDKEIANVEISGTQGKDGKDGVGISSAEVNEDGELVLYFTNDTSVNVGKVVGADGKDGVNGLDGQNGKDGQDGAPGADGKDGNNGIDGKDGKDGESAYEIWLSTGHSGSEKDFLQWLKGDNDPFGNVVTSIGFDGIAAGTSLKGKTVKDVLIMLLGIQESSNQSVVDYITENSIPFYSGLEGEGHSEVEYQQLDTATAKHTDQGFYTTTDDNGEITNAGYQMTFKENTESVAQTFAVCTTARIVTAYQYYPALNQWLDMGFDGTYWIENGTVTEVINGQEVTYTTYVYNEELMGDVIVSPEYWRFEVEVI
jgi:hypothetical protein